VAPQANATAYSSGSGDSGLRYWISNAAGNWSDASRWSYTSGGTGGAAVPASTNTVVFDGVNNSTGNVNIDLAVSMASMSVIGSYTGTINTQNYAVTIGTGGFNQTNGMFSLGSSAVSISGNMSRSGGTFNAGSSTVSFTGSTPQTLSGSTTFYALRALTSGSTLQFTAGTTQYATNMVDFENIYLRSTSNNATWYFTYTGSSQTLSAVNVKDSNASRGSMMATSNGSVDSGNNTNWSFTSTAVGILSAGSGNWYNTATWTGGVIPTATSTVTISSPHVVTATAAVTVSSISVASGGTLKFDANLQAVPFTLKNGGKLCNYGTVQITTDTFAVTIQGESGGVATFEGNDIDYAGNKVYLGRLTYQPAMSLSSGETVELSADTTLGGTVSAASGSSFVVGANNILTLIGNSNFADGTFTRGTGSARVKLNGNMIFGPGANNLGDVATGP
jgi:hypothetical protein